MNYFSPDNAAERYSKGRPDFHENTVAHIKKFLRPDQKLNKVLDIACGTGLSTKALLPIAENVFGTDVSEAMLKRAVKQDKIQYQLATASAQPFADHEFDLITVSSGVHWFDIDPFLHEANRLLKHNAWLVIYENYFISEMEDVGEFSHWFPEVYLAKFPSPPRNDQYKWTNENLGNKNFMLVEEEKFKNQIRFTKKELALYFTSQSNITAIVENGQSSYDEIEDWLDKELSVFFTANSSRIISYGNWIKFIQKK